MGKQRPGDPSLMMTGSSRPPGEERKKYPWKCSVCGGEVAKGTIGGPLPDCDGAIWLIEGVPAAVCDQCPE